jgi:hypothetical protein
MDMPIAHAGGKKVTLLVSLCGWGAENDKFCKFYPSLVRLRTTAKI